MDATGYQAMLLRLLPQGRAWPRDRDSVTGQLLGAFGDAAARVERLMLKLLENADPRTAVDLIDQWEAALGLPDTDVVPADLDGRLAAAWAKETSTGGQSKPYFIAVAESLGYEVTINGYRPGACGDRMGTRCWSTAWRFTWTVTVADPGPAPMLEAVFNKLKPADSAVTFIYEE